MVALIAKGDVGFINEKGRLTLYKKDRLEKGARPKSLWLDSKYDSSAYGAVLLKKMFENKKIFDYPKSLYAVLDAIFVASNNKKDSIILDFFAGSGTTGHAVLELNKRDGGNRKFILCTNNENNICTNVCYPRIKKVIEGYKDSNNENHFGLGGNLKFFKTGFVDAEPTDINKEKMVKKSTEMLCLKENCFEELEHGNNFKIFNNNKDKLLGIVYEDTGIPSIKKEIKKLNQKFVVYVFSLDDSAREDQFEDVKNLVELRPIPAVILNIYRRIFK
jgi:adenine-specific DNA-methyltransferase